MPGPDTVANHEGDPSSLRDVDGAIVDVDGTLFRGSNPIPEAFDGLQTLIDAGVEVLYCSNNPTTLPAAYVDRLADQGIDATPEQVLTSASVTASFLADRHAGDPTWVVGNEGLIETLDDRGIEITDDVDEAAVVVGSWDRSFDYETLQRSLWAIDGAEAFYGTDPDRIVPTEDRPMPGSGAIVRAMAGVADRDPDAVLGKPHPFTRSLALDRLGTASERTVVVGDRPDTDLALATEGMRSVLVLSGVTDRADIEGLEPRPDIVLPSLAAIGGLL